MDRLKLTVLPDELSVWRLDHDDPLPTAEGGAFLSMTRTADELSIVSASSAVPDGEIAEGGWRCLRVEGPLSFELTGVIADLSGTLARAEISVFVISTYDTDYLLVRSHDLERACSALREDGHDVAFRKE